MELFPYVDLKNQLRRKLDAALVGAPGGVAGLGDDGRVTFAQLPKTLAELTGAVEYAENKGKPGGYASLGGAGTVPLSQLPSSYVPKFATIEQAADPEVTDRIISPMTMHDSLGKQVALLKEQIEAVRARVPAWVAGSYKEDSIVSENGFLWRATTNTSRRPGPDQVLISATDDTYWTRPWGAAGIVDEETVQISTSTNNTSLMYGQPLDSDQIDGMVVEFNFTYFYKTLNRSYQQFGLYSAAAGDPASWANFNQYGFRGDDGNFGTLGAWALGRLEFRRSGTDLNLKFYVNGELRGEKTYEGVAAFPPSRLRFGAAAADGSVMQFKNFRLSYGTPHPDWERLLEIDAVRQYSRLIGIPSSFTPKPHSADLITSGTVAAARLPAATEAANGVVERATLAEVTTGTDSSRYVTPQGVKQETTKVKVYYGVWAAGTYPAGAEVEHGGYAWRARIQNNVEPTTSNSTQWRRLYALVDPI